MIYKGIPVLGFAAWSGTGKTTLLTRIIPILDQRGFRLGIVKHVHHAFDIDKPGKDSYKLRKSGARQIVAASRQRLAFIRELDDKVDEPRLIDALDTLHTDCLDLILVEGYKHESYPKIELYRESVGKPQLFPKDPDIFAVATDSIINTDTSKDFLDLNNYQEIADYVVSWTDQQKKK